MSVFEYMCEERQKIGKGSSRASRRSGRIPAVVYGSKKDPRHITLEQRIIDKEVQKSAFYTHVMTLKIGSETEKVIVREIHWHPVTDVALHIDFQRVDENSKIKITVPFKFINEDKSPGIKFGGILNVIHHSIPLICNPNNIPEAIIVDLDGLNVNDTLHFEDITLPAGVEVDPREHDTTIATVVSSGGGKEEATTEENQ